MTIRTMHYFFAAIVGLLAALLVIFLRSPGPSPEGQENPQSFAPAIQRAGMSVVDVLVSPTPPQAGVAFWEDPLLSGYQQQFEIQHAQRPRQGSGIVIDAEAGLILTNFHVIDGPGTLSIRDTRGRKSLASILASDPDSDLALLQSALPEMQAITLSQSPARVGDLVIALGNPYGIGQTATLGMVSGLGRGANSAQEMGMLLQTDAAINPGNSGGALINTRGELVGVTTSLLSSDGSYQGISFALPAHKASAIATRLYTAYQNPRGWFGFQLRELSQNEREFLNLHEPMLMISEVVPGGPADLAGLQKGDLLLRLNQEPITSKAHFAQLSEAYPPDTEVRLEVITVSGSPLTRSLILGERRQ